MNIQQAINSADREGIVSITRKSWDGYGLEIIPTDAKFPEGC